MRLVFGRFGRVREERILVRGLKQKRRVGGRVDRRSRQRRTNPRKGIETHQRRADMGPVQQGQRRTNPRKGIETRRRERDADLDGLLFVREERILVRGLKPS